LPDDQSSALSISDSLQICETFVSLCGESTFQGRPAFFVRASGCNLRCTWCDTDYAWTEGAPREIESIVAEAGASRINLVVVTGGEPLLQSEIHLLINRLISRGLTVLLETNGTLPIGDVHPNVRRIVDVKMPSAKASKPFLMANLDALAPHDELKFVVAHREDFEAASKFVRINHLAGRCELLLSPASGRIEPHQVAEWLLSGDQPFRLQVQLHKILWGADARGR